MTASLEALEGEVQRLAREIAALGEGQSSRVYRMSWWSEKLLDWAMERPDFKVQLFRLVDVFPATTDDADVLRHLQEYFGEADVPELLDLGVGAASKVPLGRLAVARVARRNITRMARQFIVGRTAAEAVENLAPLWRNGSAFTVDLLGEKTVVDVEADRYVERVLDLLDVLTEQSANWAPDDALERDSLGVLPRVNVSVKPTAMATHYEPLTGEHGLAAAEQRLRKVLDRASEVGAFIHVDMEHYDVKDLTLQLVSEVLDDPAHQGLSAGVVIQTYLRDSYDDLQEVIEWSASRDAPLTVRLVKGAYWDAETIHATAAGWPSPVFACKEETDANYDRCARLLLDHHGQVRAAFASHNLRSLAHAIAYAREIGLPDSDIEIQMLHGMAEPIHAAIRRLGLRLRVYAPVGELVPGMAYLVRRLLENTSNASFVRQRFAEGRGLDALLRTPDVTVVPGPVSSVAERPVTDPATPTEYEPEPVREWRRSDVRQAFSEALEVVNGTLGRGVPARIGGASRGGPDEIVSVDPADPSVVVARCAACSAGDADRAVAAAVEVAAEWSTTPVERRAAVLFGAAGWMRDRRDEIAALEVREAGKPWDQADADVCEAIDFCEYYGRELLRLPERARVQSPPGERNVMTYQAKGVAAVIAPWNFPLAIPTGMTVAALAAGNTAVLKPAEQTPAVAEQLSSWRCTTPACRPVRSASSLATAQLLVRSSSSTPTWR